MHQTCDRTSFNYLINSYFIVTGKEVLYKYCVYLQMEIEPFFLLESEDGKILG